ncbi:hypothetical protein MPSEU_000648700 [Mayamaea pseudoterrestris]|nr:hypothetical protein MPSEU_000648700 [Mayamaea pseudoterrestris]
MAQNGDQRNKMNKEDSAGNLSDTLEGLNLPYLNDSMSLSPLSPGQSPGTKDASKPLENAANVRNITGLEHPLAAAPGLTPNESMPMRLPPRPPPLSSRQDRTVSWGVAGPPPMMTVVRKDAEDEEISHMSNTDSRLLGTSPPKRNITINDLANPMESEAEKFIQLSLDELDPTKSGPSDAQQTILGHVPEDAGPEAFEDAPKLLPKPILKRSATTASRTHGRTKSTAEDLFQLTNDLSNLNQHHGMSSSIRNLGDTINMESSRESILTDQDLLMKNAATLLKRNNVLVQKDSSDTSSTTDAEHNPDDSSKPKSATDRWAALKSTVQTTSAVAMKKKTDEHDTEGRSPIDHDVESSHRHKDDDDDNHSTHNDTETMRTSSVGPGRSHPLRATARQKLKSRYKDFEDWLRFKKISMYAYVKFMFFFLIMPALGVASILYYLVGNPPCGTSAQCNDAMQPKQANVTGMTSNSTSAETDIVSITKELFTQASASWWVLFVFCRQPITLSLALATQAFVIEFLALRTKWVVKTVGPFVTLFIVQSKGWPFILFWWGAYDFMLLYGPSRWARHWLFWQPYLDVFNDQNPSGSFTSTPEYRTLLILALVVSLVVSIKRFAVGIWFGQKTYYRYAEDLTSLMKKSLIIGQVASLARDKEELGLQTHDFGFDVGRYDMQDDANGDNGSKSSNASRDYVRSPSKGAGPSIASAGGGSLMQQANLSSIQKIRINELLGAWEEPDVSRGKESRAPIAAIIQFRQSLSYLNTAFPFSVAFGPASTRKECVSSIEEVYRRLVGSDLILNFDVVASLAVRRNGVLDEERLKTLIKLFRPERNGTLTLVDFARSVDSVYKELRLLRASVANSTKMDASFERIFNVMFYFILACIVLSILGIDPIVLFASISGFVIGFAFMIGSAAAQFFEGCLFIVVRKPYDIGDRINVSNPMVDTPSSGSPGWIVKDVDLFTTTVLYGSTNEVATYSNSTLASCRIINGARSPKASVNFTIKFPMDVSYKKTQVFKGAVEEFIKARPREWRSLVAFRANRVEVDFGFVEYSVCAEHRESWQHLTMVNNSKADLTSFCLELSKKMNMRFRSPPMPIDLNFMGGAGWNSQIDQLMNNSQGPSPRPSGEDDERLPSRERSNTVESVDWRAVSEMFEFKK